VAQEFIPLYERIAAVIPGGLGAAKVPAQDINGLKRQIFEKGVLIYDPSTGKTALQPVGHQQITVEAPAGASQGPTWQQIAGYWVPAAIANAYQQLGADIVGQPLSNYRYNATKKRYEIYFENLGMYLLEDDPFEQVHLLPYGAWVLANESAPGGENSGPGAAIIRNATEAFDVVADRLGPQFTGEVIAPLVVDREGRILRVYTNVVMVWNPDTNEVGWLNLPELLGISPTPLVAQLQNEQLIFVPLDPDNQLGHHIPTLFWDDFISLYSGLEAAGNPITELAYKPGTGERISWQCFEHLCLEYDTQTGALRPTPLGQEYYQRFIEQQLPNKGAPPLTPLSIETRPGSYTVSPNAPQEVLVHISAQGKPLSNVTPYLKLHLPSGQVKFSFPPTDAEGNTRLSLPPLAESNGTPVAYDVCLLLPQAAGETCASSQFMVWQDAP